MATRRFVDRDGEEWEVTEGMVGFIEGPPSPVLRFRGLAAGGACTGPPPPGVLGTFPRKVSSGRWTVRSWGFESQVVICHRR